MNCEVRLLGLVVPPLLTLLIDDLVVDHGGVTISARCECRTD